MSLDENSGLLPRRNRQQDGRQRRSHALIVILGSLAAVGMVLRFAGSKEESPQEMMGLAPLKTSLRVPVEGHSKDKEHHDKKKEKKKEHHYKTENPRVQRRCDWVVGLFTEKYADNSEKELRTQYAVQATDPNVFYRATANIFWLDYVMNGWGELLQFENIGIHAAQSDGTPLQKRSTWTWITGDQHLSNFGAWKNRHGDVVFSVNDFDEAAIYDFQVDVLRIAVSVCSHAYTNGLSKQDIDHVLLAFTDTYVETLTNYVGGDKELLFELTPETASGSLQTFLQQQADNKSTEKQLEKFTEGDGVDRHFIHDENLSLGRVDPDVARKIREQFTADNFGATMMKMGWHVRSWDDDFFEVLDIAARIGTGVGSYGVDRYYVLLRGIDGALGEDDQDGEAVILDVKFEPPGAVSGVLTPEEVAWYDNLFAHDAERAVQAQRRLTSYVDPFTGWVVLDDKAFVVRQRSPWKSVPDIGDLTEPDDFVDFMEQVAVATATSHARGTVAKSPGQFKHVIASALGHWLDREIWGKKVAQVAHEYREQVLLDFECFKEFVEKNYS